MIGRGARGSCVFISYFFFPFLFSFLDFPRQGQGVGAHTMDDFHWVHAQGGVILLCLSLRTPSMISANSPMPFLAPTHHTHREQHRRTRSGPVEVDSG